MPALTAAMAAMAAPGADIASLRRSSASTRCPCGAHVGPRSPGSLRLQMRWRSTLGRLAGFRIDPIGDADLALGLLGCGRGG